MAKDEIFFPKVMNKARIFTLISPIQDHTKVPDNTIGHKKEIEGIQIGEEEIKCLSFPDYMIIYMGTPKNFN